MTGRYLVLLRQLPHEVLNSPRLLKLVGLASAKRLAP